MSWTQDYHWGKAPWGGFSSHSDRPHIEVIVTWMIRVKTTLPQPVQLLKKCGTSRLNSWLIGSLMATSTLHTSSIPTWGMLQFSTRRMGTNLASPVITNCYHSYPSHPSMSVQPYPSCSRTHTKNHTAVTPGCQSLDAEPQQPWPQLTLTVIVPVGINTTINDLKFCAQYKWHFRYPTCLPP